MSLLNPAILYGLGLIAIPVILHFLMRTKPKKLLFPALRLIEIRRKNNVRRMRLRHVWLLLLRILVIGLLVLAIARPSLPAANYAFTLREWIALLAVLAGVAGLYVACVAYWKRQRIPNHVFTYRRSLLRGGSGVAGILLFLLVVIWPYQQRIAAEISGPLPEVGRNLPIAGVFLFDTSPSMGYRFENKTRLDVAQEIALDHLSNLPHRSRLAVADSSNDRPILFQSDLLGAQARLKSVEVKPSSVPLNDRLRRAIELQQDDVQRTLDQQESVPDDLRTDRFVREIYLFTDMARSHWRLSAARFLHDAMSRAPWLHVYLVDVSVEQPRNVRISDLRLSKQTLSLGSDLIVQATVAANGTEAEEHTVELFVQDESGESVKQGQSTVTLDADGAANVSFVLSGLSGPISQGELRLTSSDPLPIDDVRYFTVAVRPPPEILIVAENRNEARFWNEALAPSELVRLGKARYRTRVVTASRFDPDDLNRYAVICLINVRNPSAAVWDALEQFVNVGGGLAVVLGDHRINPVDYNSGAAREILPAQLDVWLRFRPPEYLDMRNLQHPMLKKFDDLGGVGELTSAEVHRYWRVEPHENATLIAPYSNERQAPALLERVHGKGRTILLTTAVDLQGWSDLPLARWSFVAFADQMMQYLGQQIESRFNYLIDEDVLLRIDREANLYRYLLRKPQFQQLPGEVPPEADHLRIQEADQLGHYELLPVDDNSSFSGGFSVNLPAEASDFTRLNSDELDRMLGEKRYSVAQTIEELERSVAAINIGQEVFPLVLFVMLFAFCAEHLVANRFYDSDQAPEHR